MFWVYILQIPVGRFYIGQSDDPLSISGQPVLVALPVLKNAVVKILNRPRPDF